MLKYTVMTAKIHSHNLFHCELFEYPVKKCNGKNFCADLTMHVPTTEKKIEIVEFGFKFYDINITIL